MWGMKTVFLVVLLAATLVSPVGAQVQVGIHIPFLNFGGVERPETVVATYFKQTDGSVIWLDLNARHAEVVEPDSTFRLSWQESRIGWLLSGGEYGYGYGGYGSRNYARQVRLTANVCPANAVIRQEETSPPRGKRPRTMYGCRVQKFTFSSGDFIVSDPRYYPQQVSIIYFCGAWASGYWLSTTGCPVAPAPQSLPAVASLPALPQYAPAPAPAPPTPLTPPDQVPPVLSGKYFDRIPDWKIRGGIK